MKQERIWTSAQLNAITASSKSILVSAAAGSGKTAVLTERIIRKLTDPENPSDLSRVLIVTFTKSAAAELKQRISGALSEKIAEFPGNPRLFRQYASLNRAKISTIDSFCYDLVKQNFEKLGLHPKVRLLDEKQDQLLSDEVISSVLEEYYEDSEDIQPDEKIPHFSAFSDNFSVLRDDRMLEAFQALYKKLSVLPEGIRYLKNAAERFRFSVDADFMQTPWGDITSSEISRLMRHFEKQTGAALSCFAKNPYLFERNAEAFEYQANYIGRILTALSSKSYSDLRNVFNDYHPPRLLPMKAELKTDVSESFRAMREQFGKTVSDLMTHYFLMEPQEISSTALRSSEITANLYSFLLRYERRMNREKIRRGVLNYADLERYAYQLLYTENGSLSAAAADISAKYDEIYIDEYQDVNELQDKIFTAIAGRASRFMVGDIKQSIYSFRGAAPKLFADYRASELINAIFLQTNFRCDRPIIDFSNAVFRYLFTHNENRMPYTAEDALVCGKGNTSGNAKVTLAAIEGEPDRIEFASKEADWVADKIRSLHSEGYKYGDIAILLRSTSGSSVYYEKALEKREIPFYSQISHDFFENAEVLLMLSLINCIDNPTRDVYLAAVLKSPLFGFSLDDLIRIRMGSKGYTLYDALKAYCLAHPEFLKGSAFLDKLHIYRKSAAAMPVDRLIWYLYQDTGILSMVYDSRQGDKDSDGNMKRANLMLLYDYARNFENGSFKGLYPFIRYLNEILSSGTKLETAKSVSESADTVKIMTVHKSKGLEFPVCFVADTGKSVLHNDGNSLIITDRSLGPAFRLSDETGFAQIDSPFRRAVLRSVADESISEEMRILYVALTRAKERLFVSGLVKGNLQERIKRCRSLADSSFDGSNYAVLTQSDYLSWILIALYASNYQTYDLILLGNPEKTEPDNTEAISEKTAAPPSSSAPDLAEADEIYNLLKKRFAFIYPYEASFRIPAKVSVSDLKPSLLDEYPDALDISPEHQAPKLKKPLFLEPDPEAATAAEKGTATHVFMQFCDFAYIEKHGVAEEILRLTESSYLSRKTAALIQIDRVKRFFSSSLYYEMRNAQELYRETRFNIKMPAAAFATDPSVQSELSGEEVLVQGVIDCFFVSHDGKVTVVDYKTDAIPREIKTQAEADSFIIQRHAAQINYYRQAVRQLLCKDCSKALIYVFSTGHTVVIPDT